MIQQVSFLVFIGFGILYSGLMTVNFNASYAKKGRLLKIFVFGMYCGWLTILWSLDGDFRVRAIFSIFSIIPIFFIYKRSLFCKKCGAPTSKSWVFKTTHCPKCGTKLGVES